MCWLIWGKSWNVTQNFYFSFIILTHKISRIFSLSKHAELMSSLYHFNTQNFWCSLTVLAQHKNSKFSLHVKHTELLMLPLAVLTLTISDFPHTDNALNFWCSLTILAQYRTYDFWLTVWIPPRTFVSFPSDVSCRALECINPELLIPLTFLSESPRAWLPNLRSLLFCL